MVSGLAPRVARRRAGVGQGHHSHQGLADAARMLDVLSLPDARDWHALPHASRDWRTGLDLGVRDLRIAFSPTLGYAKVDPEVAALVKDSIKVFEDLGAKVEEKHPGFENP